MQATYLVPELRNSTTPPAYTALCMYMSSGRRGGNSAAARVAMCQFPGADSAPIIAILEHLLQAPVRLGKQQTRNHYSFTACAAEEHT